MPIISDDAVVLMRLDYSETSQVLVFFSRTHGKIRAIAKGVKRGTKTRPAVGIDLLEVGRLVVSSRSDPPTGLANLTEWKQSVPLGGLRDRRERLLAAQYAVELIGYLTEEADPQPELFDAACELFVTLAEADDVLPAVTAFQVRLLTVIGLMPRFDACVLCDRKDALTYFSAHQGGMICNRCGAKQVEKHRVSKPTLLALQGSAAPPTMTGPFNLLNYHLAHAMGRQPRLAVKLAAATKTKRGE